MSEDKTSKLPTWSPRIARRHIERLYRTCGRGILDEDLIDEVGVGLYVRCESILKVKKAMRGRVTCPDCEVLVRRTCHVSEDELLQCPSCGWKCTWQEFRGTFEGEFLNAGDMERFCRDYLGTFAAAKTPGEKLVLIDTLIHRLHGELVGGNKPGAYAFIEGNIADVASFLDRLTYGPDVPEDIKVKREAWRARVRTGSSFWTKQLAEDRATEKHAET